MNQRAVNTVVGTVILVGVVVILAAAVGVFVLGIGGTMFESPPSAMVEVEPQPDGNDLTHMSGDPLETSRLYLRGEGTEIPMAELTDTETLEADTVSLPTFPVSPEDGSPGELQLVWEGDHTETVVTTVDEYSASTTFTFEGEEPQVFDASAIDQAYVEVAGAGGEPADFPEASYGGAGAGGHLTMTLDVSNLDELEMYVGESPESTRDDPAGGWGWLDGGKPDSGGDSFVGGGGGGATAILGDDTLLAVAHGGGGGGDWDTNTVYGGGGGGGGGEGNNGWWGGTPTGEDGEGDGLGGDGAGQEGGDGEDMPTDSFISGTSGQAELEEPGVASNVEIDERSGASPGQHGEIRVTYEIG